MTALGRAALIMTVCAIMGAVAGTFLARQAIADVEESFQVSHDGWLYSETVGTRASSGLERARIAVSGPLALSSSEVAYFLATEDEDGQPLNSMCTYTIHGGRIDSRWWSITLYNGATRNYVASGSTRASYTSSALGDGETWRIQLAAEDGDLPTLKLPKDNVPLELLLRVYQPNEDLRNEIPFIDLPQVERQSCVS